MEQANKLIKFCPYCGHESEKNFIATLSNGGAWYCEGCEEEVEAYVLSK
jgi:hypothetical protein